MIYILSDSLMETAAGGSMEVGADGAVVAPTKKIPEEEIITEKSGKRTNPSKPGVCELHLWSPQMGSKVFHSCRTALFGPPMLKVARPATYGGIGCESFNGGNVFGQMVVVDRGVCAFGNKALLGVAQVYFISHFYSFFCVKACYHSLFCFPALPYSCLLSSILPNQTLSPYIALQGAESIIVINQGRGVMRMPSGDPEPSIPGAMVSQEEGAELKDLLSKGTWIAKIIPKGYQ